MTDSSSQIHPWVKRLVIAVTAVSLVPITLGALVTTMKAGMAFADWPSSDGHQMLLYPWLRDFGRDPARFVEHGHRLAGVLIGVLSLILVAVTFAVERTPWIRRYTVAILVAVIFQGLLGGARVVFDRATLAMLHSVSGAMFFCLCGGFLTLVGGRWHRTSSGRDSRLTPTAFGVIVLLPVAVSAQYLLGGAVRHLHTMIDEHLAGAFVLTNLTLWAVVSLYRSENSFLRGCGRQILLLLSVQVVLGLASYVARLGLPAHGIVAVEGSVSQAIFCSLHTVAAMLLLSATVTASTGCLRLRRAGQLTGLNFAISVGPVVPVREGVL